MQSGHCSVAKYGLDKMCMLQLSQDDMPHMGFIGNLCASFFWVSLQVAHLLNIANAWRVHSGRSLATKAELGAASVDNRAHLSVARIAC